MKAIFLTILREMAEGKTNGEIAVAVGVKEKTVKNYVSQIYDILGARHRTEAVVKAIEQGIIGKASQMGMTSFRLVRKQDVEGVTGTGIIAEGVVFSNGCVVVAWLPGHGGVNVHTSIEVVKTIYCYGGMTEIIYTEGAK